MYTYFVSLSWFLCMIQLTQLQCLLSYFHVIFDLMSCVVGSFSTDTSDPDHIQAVLLAALQPRQCVLSLWTLPVAFHSLTSLNSLNSTGMFMLMAVCVSDSGSRQWVLSMLMSRQRDTSFSSALLLRGPTAATSLSETMEVGNTRVRWQDGC